MATHLAAVSGRMCPNPRTPGGSTGAGRSRSAHTDVSALVLAIMLGAIPLGLLLSRMAVGGNMKGQATLAMVPWALAVFIDSFAGRSVFSRVQRVILRLALGMAIILISIGIFAQPREEFDQNRACGAVELGQEPCPPGSS